MQRKKSEYFDQWCDLRFMVKGQLMNHPLVRALRTKSSHSPDPLARTKSLSVILISQLLILISPCLFLRITRQFDERVIDRTDPRRDLQIRI